MTPDSSQAQNAPVEAERVITDALAADVYSPEGVGRLVIKELSEAGFSLVHESEREKAVDAAERATGTAEKLIDALERISGHLSDESISEAARIMRARVVIAGLDQHDRLASEGDD